MNEKTKWFYCEFKTETQAVVLLAHGLNLLPSKMDQLAHFFSTKKCDVLRISLGEFPEKWEEKFKNDYCMALEHAEILQRPLYFVGFSLGALIGIHHLLKNPQHQFEKLALFAPATHTHFYTIIPAMVGKFFPTFALPSFNLGNYRERKSTTLDEYQKIHQLQKSLRHLIIKDQMNRPTLLIINPKDELVSSSQLKKLAKRHSQWEYLEISNKDSLLPKKYHHLIIDSDAIGLEEWDKLIKSLSAHFDL
jgi:alpha-beta hydrolase superfamily lysophospholipase